MIQPKILKQFVVEPGSEVNLKNRVTDWTETSEAKEFGKDFIKERAAESLEMNRKQLAEAQELLYAADTHSVLVILQAMDAAGKDGTIRHVMAGVNPQGCQVFSFKKSLPERGRIGIFNRSYYEDVLVVKVHPEWLGPGSPAKPDKSFWEKRYEDINNFEKHLARNGTLVLKFFLHVSKDEQKRRFLERLTDPEKHWKFSLKRTLRNASTGRPIRKPSRTRSPPPAPNARHGMSFPPTASMWLARSWRTSSSPPSRGWD
jgi:polyphosphate kinase 2 (PPK2 family)